MVHRAGIVDRSPWRSVELCDTGTTRDYFVDAFAPEGGECNSAYASMPLFKQKVLASESRAGGLPPGPSYVASNRRAGSELGGRVA